MSTETLQQAKKLGFLFVMTSMLGGCVSTGSDYRPVVDGSDLANYESDLSRCQALAKNEISSQSQAQSKTGSGAIIGAVIGTIAGLAEGAEEALAGAAIGALVGGGIGSHQETKQNRQNVIECMRGKGYNVIASD